MRILEFQEEFLVRSALIPSNALVTVPEALRAPPVDVVSLQPRFHGLACGLPVEDVLPRIPAMKAGKTASLTPAN